MGVSGLAWPNNLLSLNIDTSLNDWFPLETAWIQDYFIQIPRWVHKLGESYWGIRYKFWRKGWFWEYLQILWDKVCKLNSGCKES